MRKTSLDPLLPRLTQELLAATCMAPDRAWYQSDLARVLERTASSLQKPLAQLVDAGVLKRWQDGNRVYYQADQDCPFLPELTGMIAKTTGLVDVLREALRSHGEAIQLAFVYGSLARGKQRSTSDVDLLVVSDLGLRHLADALERAEAVLRRPVNATVLSAAELERRVRDRNHFLQAILAGEKMFVVGSADELETITQGRPRRDASHVAPRAQRSAGSRRSKSRGRHD